MSDIPPGSVPGRLHEEGVMNRLLLFAVASGVIGCGDSTAPPAGKPPDPVIRVKEAVGGGVGPVGAGRAREYEGPASQAPTWAKPGVPPAK